MINLIQITETLITFTSRHRRDGERLRGHILAMERETAVNPGYGSPAHLVLNETYLLLIALSSL